MNEYLTCCMPPVYCSAAVDSVSVASVCTDNPSLPGDDILLMLCCSPSVSSLFSPLFLNMRASCHKSFSHQIYNFVLCIKCNLSINAVKMFSILIFCLKFFWCNISFTVIQLTANWEAVSLFTSSSAHCSMVLTVVLKLL